MDRVKAIIAEKEEALKLARKALQTAKEPHSINKQNSIIDSFAINLMYVDLFAVVTDALILTRYVLETDEPKNSEFYSWARTECDRKIQALEEKEVELRNFFVSTSIHPHTVYTLLDPDRVRCLYLDLKRKLENVQYV